MTEHEMLRDLADAVLNFVDARNNHVPVGEFDDVQKAGKIMKDLALSVEHYLRRKAQEEP